MSRKRFLKDLSGVEVGDVLAACEDDMIKDIYLVMGKHTVCPRPPRGRGGSGPVYSLELMSTTNPTNFIKGWIPSLPAQPAVVAGGGYFKEYDEIYVFSSARDRRGREVQGSSQ